jgi:hypothetical protein
MYMHNTPFDQRIYMFCFVVQSQSKTFALVVIQLIYGRAIYIIAYYGRVTHIPIKGDEPVP